VANASRDGAGYNQTVENNRAGAANIDPRAALSGAVADAVYIGVGLTILGIQRTNVFRRELRVDLEKRLGTPLTLPALAALAADGLDSLTGSSRSNP
jgi:hypothetical protein